VPNSYHANSGIPDVTNEPRFLAYRRSRLRPRTTRHVAAGARDRAGHRAG
jgi:hypothetical protein